MKSPTLRARDSVFPICTRRPPRKTCILSAKRTQQGLAKFQTSPRDVSVCHVQMDTSTLGVRQLCQCLIWSQRPRSLLGATTAKLVQERNTQAQCGATSDPTVMDASFRCQMDLTLITQTVTLSVGVRPNATKKMSGMPQKVPFPAS